MSYNPEALIFEKQVVINDTTNAGSTSGGLVIKGGLSSKDTYITGHVAVNNVKITPNLNDIINEVEKVLSNSITEFTDISDFYFDNSITNSFKAHVSVTVTPSKYALWELIGVYKPSGWSMTTSFTGDITGVNFSIVNDLVNNRGKIQYTNTNSSGTTTIKFRATTTQPPGSSPTGSTGIINNTSGPYVVDTLVYANSTSTITSSDITYSSNVLKIGSSGRLVGENANSFTNFSNGGAITSMGDASIAKNLIVGSKIAIAKTSPAFTLDIGGDINFTGDFYQNGSPYSGSSIWATNGTDVFYTAGNVGLGTTSPQYRLDVSGTLRSTDIRATNITSTSLVVTNITVPNLTTTNVTVASLIGTNGNFTNTTIANGHFTNISATAVTSGSFIGTLGNFTNINSTNLTSSNIISTNSNFTNSTIGTVVVTNVTANSINSETFSGTNADFTNASIGSGLFTNVNATTVTAGTIHATTGTFTNLNGTNATVGSLSATNGNLTNITIGSAVFTNASGTSVSSGSVVGVNLNATTSTVSSFLFSNASGTAITAGSFAGSIGNITNINSTNVSAGTISSTNAHITNATVNSLVLTNATVVSVTSGSFVGTTGDFTNVNSTNITAGSLNATNGNLTNATIGSGIFTNLNATAITSSSFVGSNANFTNITVGSFSFTNASTTNITSSSLVGTNANFTNATVSSGIFTNINATNITSSSFISTNGTINNINATNITSASLVGINTNFTSSTIGTLNVSNAIATNMTSSSLVGTNANISTLTSGNIRILDNVTINLRAVTSANYQIGSFNTSANVGLDFKNSTAGNTFFNFGGNNGSNTLIRLYKLNGPGNNSYANTEYLGMGYENDRIIFQSKTSGSGTLRPISIGMSNSDLVIETSGNVGIGTTSPSVKLDVNGTARFNSSVTFGSFYAGSGTVAGHLVPSTNVTYDLGSSTLRWKDLYLSGSTIYLGDKQLSLSGDTFTLEQINVTSTNDSTGPTSGAFIVAGGMGIAKDLYIGQNLVVNGNLTIQGTTTTVDTQNINMEDNLLVLNNGPAGLADGGVLVKRYESGTSGSVNYAGVFYKEALDEYTFATTSSDPGSSPVTVNTYIPIRSGRVYIENTENATGLGTGGSLNVAGGASIIKDVYVGGNVAATGTVTASSDIRLKENINTLENTLDKIKNFRGVTYTKKDSGENEIGFIAQELEESFPELVETNSDGYKSVAYGNMSAVLLQCIKELQHEIQTIKSSLN